MRENDSDTLIVTYGRLCGEAHEAQEALKNEEINCDLLKLTKIYPLDRKLIPEMKKYRHIVFFEESMGSGGISEKFGEILAESSYDGDYGRVAADDFIKQASVKSCLEHMGLSSGKMAEYIRNRRKNDGKA